MYVIGAEHPNKAVSRQLLEHAIAQGERLVTDAEVLQEILHRYVAIGRRDAIQPAFEALLGVVDEVFPVERRDTEGARDLIHAMRALSARDALHVAIMRRQGVGAILSFDSGFDAVPGISRVT